MYSDIIHFLIYLYISRKVFIWIFIKIKWFRCPRQLDNYQQKHNPARQQRFHLSHGEPGLFAALLLFSRLNSIRLSTWQIICTSTLCWNVYFFLKFIILQWLLLFSSSRHCTRDHFFPKDQMKSKNDFRISKSNNDYISIVSEAYNSFYSVLKFGLWYASWFMH